MTQRRIYQCAFPYFVTFNVLHGEWILDDEKKAEILHEIILNAGKMKNHIVYQFCIMPNHVHILCRTDSDVLLDDGLSGPHRGLENPLCGGGGRLCDCEHVHEYNISDFVKSIRGTFSRKMHQGQMWHPRFYDQIIESDRRLRNEINYIINNPIKWDLPCRYQKYPYQYIDNELINDLFG